METQKTDGHRVMCISPNPIVPGLSRITLRCGCGWRRDMPPLSDFDGKQWNMLHAIDTGIKPSLMPVVSMGVVKEDS